MRRAPRFFEPPPTPALRGVWPRSREPSQPNVRRHRAMVRPRALAGTRPGPAAPGPAGRGEPGAPARRAAPRPGGGSGPDRTFEPAGALQTPLLGGSQRLVPAEARRSDYAGWLDPLQ